jgi:hypothetical protein
MLVLRNIIAGMAASTALAGGAVCLSALTYATPASATTVHSAGSCQCSAGSCHCADCQCGDFECGD